MLEEGSQCQVGGIGSQDDSSTEKSCTPRNQFATGVDIIVISLISVLDWVSIAPVRVTCTSTEVEPTLNRILELVGMSHKATICRKVAVLIT